MREGKMPHPDVDFEASKVNEGREDNQEEVLLTPKAFEV